MLRKLKLNRALHQAIAGAGEFAKAATEALSPARKVELAGILAAGGALVVEIGTAGQTYLAAVLVRADGSRETVMRRDFT